MATTIPELPSATTRAQIVRFSSGYCLLELLHLFRGQDVHHFVSLAPVTKQFGRQAHRTFDVVEEQFVASAQVVQPCFPVWRVDEAVARAFPVTGEQHLS